MSVIATDEGVVSATTRWLRGLWEYYREYTHTAVHAAATAALTAFGLLIFVNRLFVLLAIASYVIPPVILYSIGYDVGKSSLSDETNTRRTDRGASPSTDSRATGRNPGREYRDWDTNSDGGDTDSDSDDGDTDSDSDDGDTDSDSDDGDTDSDSDDGDTDSDSDDGDTDSDSDDGDTDSDS